jgi:hypothetical protein
VVVAEQRLTESRWVQAERQNVGQAFSLTGDRATDAARSYHASGLNPSDKSSRPEAANALAGCPSFIR